MGKFGAPLSLTTAKCNHLSEATKTLYEMLRGAPATVEPRVCDVTIQSILFNVLTSDREAILSPRLSWEAVRLYTGEAERLVREV
jgi:hypothetical protein